MYAALVTCAFLILFLFLELFYAKMIGSIFSPVTIYNFMWTIVPILSSYGIAGLYIPSAETYFIIAISLISFNLGVYFVSSVQKKRSARVFFKTVEYKRNLFVVCTIIAIIITIPYVVRSLDILLSDGWVKLRYYYLNASTNRYLMTTREVLFLKLFIFPLFTVGQIVVVQNFFLKKNDHILLILTIISTAATTLITGGRTLIFNFFADFVIMYFLNWKPRSKKLTTTQRVLVGILVVVLIYITSIRTIGDTSVLENIALYFIGPIVYLDRIVLNPVQFGLSGNILLGRATFGFLTTTVEMFMSILLGFSYNGVDGIVSSYTGIYYNLSNSAKGNHIYTELYPFMLDYGKAGIVIGPMIFGAVTMWLIKRLIISHNTGRNILLWQTLMISFSFAIFYSQFEYRFLYPDMFMTILYTIVFMSSKRTQTQSQ